MNAQKIVFLIAKIVVIIGALNWGAVAGFNKDLVPLIVGQQFDRYVKILVGICGIITAYGMYRWYVKSQEEKKEGFDCGCGI